MDDDRAARARARATWPGCITTLDAEADAAIVRHGTAAERLAMLWRVTLDAWASAGRALPRYSRAAMPIRIVRADDPDAAGSP
jgi:hypothetical protein